MSKIIPQHELDEFSSVYEEFGVAEAAARYNLTYRGAVARAEKLGLVSKINKRYYFYNRGVLLFVGTKKEMMEELELKKSEWNNYRNFGRTFSKNGENSNKRMILESAKEKQVE